MGSGANDFFEKITWRSKSAHRPRFRLPSISEDDGTQRAFDYRVFRHALYSKVRCDCLRFKFYGARIENALAAREVKSADNTKSKSLKSIMENWGVEKGIKLSSKNIGVSNNVSSYPLYMIMFL